MDCQSRGGALNEENYRRICEACDRALSASDTTLERVAIPWLHVLNEHPANLTQYAQLFERRKASLSDFLGATKRFLSVTKTFMKALIFRRQINIPPKVDVLIISHLLNQSQVGAVEDFYFGKLPEFLIAKGLNTVVALRNQVSKGIDFTECSWPTTMARRILLPETLSWLNELRLKHKLREEAVRLKKTVLRITNDFDARIYETAAQQAVAPSAIATLRLHTQIKDMVKVMQPTSIVVTYEGHAWERIVFAAARSVNPYIRCIGYHHTILFPRQHAISRTLCQPYDPDIICTAGHVTREILEKSFGLGCISVVTVGVHRQQNLEVIFSEKVRAQFAPACLVIPDGTISECLLFFNYVLKAAIELPTINFIVRLHPVMPLSTIIDCDVRLKSLPRNVQISNDEIEIDFERCRWVIYRGSSAVIRAVATGLRPFYLKPANEILNIDPLNKMNSWKRIVQNTTDLKEGLDFDLSNNFEDLEKEWLSAHQYCKQYFTPQNYEKFYHAVLGDQG